ncbi:MAG TPA: P-loop NTPase fold protein [Acidimicrobiales bacterium]|jgi:hypothetical protein|nr:P-loop NTPase fold protein [Acidimicrobiales bacterium]
MATAPSPTLQRGDAGPAVTKLQRGLTELGFDPGPADGAFGKRTQEALAAFQRSVGLDIDAVYGRSTEDALTAELASRGPEAAPIRLTRSVEAIADRVGDLTSYEVARSLWLEHPRYPAREAAIALLEHPPRAAPRRPGVQWVLAVADLIDPSVLAAIASPEERVLHGQLLLYGLARLDARLHEVLSDAGALDELRRSITPDPDTLLGAGPDPHRPPARSQNARLVADTPATEDLLDRESFANSLAVLIDGQRNDSGTDASGPILVHLYGAWGSGKTTLFGLLRRALESPGEGLPLDDDGWLCVTFNAWGHQRTAPPWWWLMDRVYREARTHRRDGELVPLPWLRRLRIWAWWWGLAIATLVAVAALLVVALVSGIALIDRMADAKDAVNAVIGLFVAAGSAIALARTTKSSVLVGSPRAATALLRSGGDPYRRITGRYAKLVDKIDRNVLVFIDDLDRCQPAYVVELLEGIQTIFKDAPVTYLVAADREWVSESFQQVYADLGPVMDRPGRPLGYLFLEKTFAVSAPLPRPSPEAQQRYWRSVLTGGGPEMAAITTDDRRAAEAELAQASPEDAARRAADLSSTDLSGGARALREKAAIKLAEAVVSGEQDHVLVPYLPLLEPNPRALKRLRNAYAIAAMGRFASLDIATTDEDVDALVRWTILTLRWPRLARRLTDQPRGLPAILDPNGPAPDDDLGPLHDDEDLRHLLQTPVRGGVTPNLGAWVTAEFAWHLDVSAEPTAPPS